MKNFFKFLGIISMVLIIGFSMAACDNGDDDDDGDDSSTTGGATFEFPAEFITHTGLNNTGEVGSWTSTTLGDVEFMSKTGTVFTAETYKITSISGKTIKVKKYDSSYQLAGDEIILCTDYARTGTGKAGTLTLTGASGDFANIGVLTAKQ